MERTPDDLFKIKNFAILKSPLPRHLFKGAITSNTSVSSPFGGAPITGVAKPVTTHPTTPNAFFVRPRLPPSTAPHAIVTSSNITVASLATASPSMVSPTGHASVATEEAGESVYLSERMDSVAVQPSNQETAIEIPPTTTISNPSSTAPHAPENEPTNNDEDSETRSASTYASEHEESHPVAVQPRIDEPTTKGMEGSVIEAESRKKANIQEMTDPASHVDQVTKLKSPMRMTAVPDDGDKHNKPDVIFSEWSFGIAPNTPRVTNVSKEDSQEWIVLVGRRPDTAELWHSSIVTRRLAHNRIETGSGRVYILRDGSMDSQRMADHGFGDSFSAKFAKGFPTNWQQLLITELTRIATSRAPRKPVTIPLHPRGRRHEAQQPKHDESQPKKVATARKRQGPRQRLPPLPEPPSLQRRQRPSLPLPNPLHHQPSSMNKLLPNHQMHPRQSQASVANPGRQWCSSSPLANLPSNRIPTH